MPKLAISASRDEMSSSPLTDCGGEAFGVFNVVTVPIEEQSLSSTVWYKVQYMMLAVRVRIIFGLTWFTIRVVEV